MVKGKFSQGSGGEMKGFLFSAATAVHGRDWFGTGSYNVFRFSKEEIYLIS